MLHLSNVFHVFQEDPWVTKDGQCPLPSEEDNCHLVEVTDEDVEKVVTSIPKLDTLILIKHMLKKHSFQNPFVHKRDVHRTSNLVEAPTHRHHIGKSGRSNSAPDSYVWLPRKQLSLDLGLESVTEVNLDKDDRAVPDDGCSVIEKR